MISLSALSALLWKKRKRRIFVSYHSKNDAQYRKTLNMWSKNENFDFDFDDNSVGISINSESESVIKRGISRKINESNLIICIIGEDTHKRPLVNWELEKAQKLNKKIIPIKIKHNFKAPKCLLNQGINFIKFEQKSIQNAIFKS